MCNSLSLIQKCLIQGQNMNVIVMQEYSYLIDISI